MTCDVDELVSLYFNSMNIFLILGYYDIMPIMLLSSNSLKMTLTQFWNQIKEKSLEIILDCDVEPERNASQHL